MLLKSFNQIGQYHYGSQIGLDGKIYLSYNFFPSPFAPYYLARINCPNVPGLGCGYQDTAVNLEDRRPGVFFSCPQPNPLCQCQHLAGEKQQAAYLSRG